MKSTITRALVIATLATSISAFANSDKAKADDKKNTNNSEMSTVKCAADQADSHEYDGQSSDAQDKAVDAQDKAAREKLIEQQNKAWLQDLMYNR